MRFVMSNCMAECRYWLALCQVSRPIFLFPIQYPLILDSPSFPGLSQDRSTKSPPIAVIDVLPEAYGGLALMGLTPSSGGPVPLTLAASILNRYSWPSVRLWTAKLVLLHKLVMTIHSLCLMSLLSTR